MKKEILLIHGEDSFRSALERRQQLSHWKAEDCLIDHFNPNHDDLETFLFSGSLFATQRALVFDLNLLGLKEDDPKASKNFAELIERADLNRMLFYCSKKLDSRLKESKFLSGFCTRLLEFPAFKPWDAPKVEQWVLGWCEEVGITVQPSALKKLLGVIGLDCGRLISELEKLWVYSGLTTIKLEAVSQLQQYEELTINSFEKIASETVTVCKKLLGTLRYSGDPFMLAASLTGQLRRDLEVTLLREEGLRADKIAQITARSPYVIEKDLGRLRNVSVLAVAGKLQVMLATESKLKSGFFLDPLMGYQLALLKIATV